MPRIVVVPFGQDHEDIAAKELLLIEVERAKSAGIKVIVLEELPYNLSLQDALAAKQAELDKAEDLLSLRRLVEAEAQETGGVLLGGRLSPQREAEFIAACRNKEEFPDLESVQQMALQLATNTITRDIARLIVNAPILRHRVRFYQRLLAAEVPFFGIDITTQMYQKIRSLAQNEQHQLELLAYFEPDRIAMMTEWTWTHLKELSETGGLVLVNNMGMVHTQRFVFHLEQRLKEKPVIDKLLAEVPVTIVPLHIFSTHNQFPGGVRRYYEGLPADLARTRKQDSPEALAFYEKRPVLEVSCYQGESKEAFESPELWNAMDGLVYTKPSPSQLFDSPLDSPMLMFNIWQKPAAQKPKPPKSTHEILAESLVTHKRLGLL